MAKIEEKNKVIALRKAGKSYSQIKQEVKVSKSTLSRWLRDMPLTKGQLVKLRDKNPKRIESYRATMEKKRAVRLDNVYKRAQKNIGKLSKREEFIAGLYLYWAEGLKSGRYATSVSNTDPAILKFFIRWMEGLGVSKYNLKVKLHLYKDMNVNKVTLFWLKELGMPISKFRKPYIKDSSFEKEKVYKGRFGWGTCNIIFDNRDIKEYISMSLKYLQDIEG
ncbi:MAG: hypothetical protein ACJKSS_00165 [Patescibacteria group bacterium UBA2103]